MPKYSVSLSEESDVEFNNEGHDIDVEEILDIIEAKQRASEQSRRGPDAVVAEEARPVSSIRSHLSQVEDPAALHGLAPLVAEGVRSNSNTHSRFSQLENPAARHGLAQVFPNSRGVHQCLNFHRLELFRADWEFVCKVCRKTGVRGEAELHCRTCRFSICGSCAASDFEKHLVDTLEIRSSRFARKHNFWYTAEQEYRRERGGKRFLPPPVGTLKLGLSVGQYADASWLDRDTGWLVTYHGTNADEDSLRGILKHGLLLRGGKSKARVGETYGTGIYVSPDPCVAATFCDYPLSLGDVSNGVSSRTYHVVFQCRVRPKSYVETEASRCTWRVPRERDVRICGLLLIPSQDVNCRHGKTWMKCCSKDYVDWIIQGKKHKSRMSNSQKIKTRSHERSRSRRSCSFNRHGCRRNRTERNKEAVMAERSRSRSLSHDRSCSGSQEAESPGNETAASGTLDHTADGPPGNSTAIGHLGGERNDVEKIERRKGISEECAAKPSQAAGGSAPVKLSRRARAKKRREEEQGYAEEWEEWNRGEEYSSWQSWRTCNSSSSNSQRLSSSSNSKSNSLPKEEQEAPVSHAGTVCMDHLQFYERATYNSEASESKPSPAASQVAAQEVVKPSKASQVAAQPAQAASQVAAKPSLAQSQAAAKPSQVAASQVDAKPSQVETPSEDSAPTTAQARCLEWLLSLDDKHGALARYWPKLVEEFDGDLTQIMAVRTKRQPGSTLLAEVDPIFFEVLGVTAMGHKLLFARGISKL